MQQQCLHFVHSPVPSFCLVLNLYSATLLQVFEYAADFSHINRWDPGGFQQLCRLLECNTQSFALMLTNISVAIVGTEASENMESSKRAALIEGDKIAMSTVLLGTTTPTV